jgi:hypothetical protein
MIEDQTYEPPQWALEEARCPRCHEMGEVWGPIEDAGSSYHGLHAILCDNCKVRACATMTSCRRCSVRARGYIDDLYQSRLMSNGT